MMAARRSFAPIPLTDLQNLAMMFGSDKVPNCHVYERYLAQFRHEPINLFEIGIGGYEDPRAGGSSLRMWQEYFASGKIYALDWYDKSAHADERITIYQGSQDDAPLLNKIADDIGIIDVIVDDGSHICSHVIHSFETLFPRLVSGGLYIVEDIGTSYWENCGGSKDLLSQDTSMAYFKRLADGIQSFAFQHEYTPSYADENSSYLHFYPNFIVIRKK